MDIRPQTTRIQVPKIILTIVNQLYEVEQKVKRHGDPNNLLRNINKMRDAFAEEGLPVGGAGTQLQMCLIYEDPMAQPFKETRTDLEATISGSGTDNLVVVEVIKPIIRSFIRDNSGEMSEKDAAQFAQVIQKGIVIVETQKDKSI